MNDQPDTCFFARVFGQNWRTTLGQSCAAVGGVLGMTVAAGTWHIVGLVLFALGGVWAGVNTRDKNVSSDQMDAAGSGQPIPRAKLPGSLLVLLVCGLMALPAAADTNGMPRLYVITEAALEAHHDALARSSDYGATMRVGADYGLLAVEGWLGGPLDHGQEHARRSLGVDLLVQPLQGYWLEPFIAAGAGYYWPVSGTDYYATWAADVGTGVRLPVSKYVFLQLDARVCLPFSATNNKLCPADHFEVLGLGIGARY